MLIEKDMRPVQLVGNKKKYSYSEEGYFIKKK
jgi:hypothetical protein